MHEMRSSNLGRKYGKMINMHYEWSRENGHITDNYFCPLQTHHSGLLDNDRVLKNIGNIGISHFAKLLSFPEILWIKDIVVFWHCIDNYK